MAITGPATTGTLFKLDHEWTKGVLLMGPSGTGKTDLAIAVLNEVKMHCNTLMLKCSDLLSPYFAETSQNINAVFTFAHNIGPIIFWGNHLAARAFLWEHIW